MLSDIVINGQISQGQEKTKKGDWRTYIGTIFIHKGNFSLAVTPTNIYIAHKQLQWDNNTLKSYVSGVNLWIETYKNDILILHVNFKIGLKVKIRRVLSLDSSAIDYLNVFFDDEKGLSRMTEGVIGMCIELLLFTSICSDCHPSNIWIYIVERKIVLDL